MIEFDFPYISPRAFGHVFRFLKDFSEKNDKDLCQRLEAAFEKFLKAEHVIGCHSGTMALVLSLLTLDIEEGDEIITNPLSHRAAISAIINSGAKPVFAKIKDSGYFDMVDLNNRIGRRTKAILCVHFNGFPEDIKTLLGLKKKYNVRIIEDASQALGTRIKTAGEWKYAGTLGDIGIYSFASSKIFTTVDGGMIATNDHAISEKIKKLASQGEYSGPDILLGYNCRLDSLRAALGLANIADLGDVIRMRKANWNTYKRKLSGLKWAKIIEPPLDTEINYSCMILYIRDEKITEKLAMAFKKIKYNMPEMKTFPNEYIKLTSLSGSISEIMRHFKKHLIFLPTHTHIGTEEIKKLITCFTKI